jgi:hypothetical protein
VKDEAASQTGSLKDEAVAQAGSMTPGGGPASSGTPG